MCCRDPAPSCSYSGFVHRLIGVVHLLLQTLLCQRVDLVFISFWFLPFVGPLPLGMIVVGLITCCCVKFILCISIYVERCMYK